MRHIPISSLLFIVIAGCQKQDIRFNNGRISKCDVAEVSGVISQNGTSYGSALQKTYYPSGLPKTLTAVLFENFGAVDTVKYEITYKGIAAHIKAYSRALAGNAGPEDPATYNFDVRFDMRSGYVTRIGDHTFEYKDGRLIKFDGYLLEYDQKGNITRINSKRGAVIYTYDYNKKGKREFYITAGNQVGETYNLAETLGWIPVQPNNPRLSHVVSWGFSPEGEEYIAGGLSIENHQYDRDGFLISYFMDGEKVSNKWRCQRFGLPSKL